MYTKDILILAKSQKNNGTCIGGLDITDHRLEDGRKTTSLKWVRPVKAIPTESFKQPDFNKLIPLDLNENYRGVEFELLDVITMTFIKPTPLNYQPENELVDLDTPWIKRTDFDYRYHRPGGGEEMGITANNRNTQALTNLVHMDKNQLMDHSIQFYSPKHDSVPKTCFIAEPAENSLQFLKLTHEENKTRLLYESRNSWNGGITWNPRLEFIYKGKFHNLSITDLEFPKLKHVNDDPLTYSLSPSNGQPIKLRDTLIPLADDDLLDLTLPCPINDAFISIGFGGEFNGKHYKFITGLICELTQPEWWH